MIWVAGLVWCALSIIVALAVGRAIALADESLYDYEEDQQ